MKDQIQPSLSLIAKKEHVNPENPDERMTMNVFSSNSEEKTGLYFFTEYQNGDQYLVRPFLPNPDQDAKWSDPEKHTEYLARMAQEAEALYLHAKGILLITGAYLKPNHWSHLKPTQWFWDWTDFFPGEHFHLTVPAPFWFFVNEDTKKQVHPALEK